MTPEEVKEIVEAVRPKNRVKEFLGTGAIIAGWVVSIAYFTGSFGERVQNLERQQAQLSQSISSVMQVAVAQEKFNSIQMQLEQQEKHLENTDKAVEGLKRR